MNHLRFLLVGFGFMYIFVGSILGSLLGAQLNRIVAASGSYDALWTWQKQLLSTAHAHLNVMSMTLILMGFSIPMLGGIVSHKWIRRCVGSVLYAVPLFCVGLFCEAFSPPAKGEVSYYTGLTALGGAVYMVVMGVWAAFLITGYFKSKQK
jgi:hypothetical protein